MNDIIMWIIVGLIAALILGVVIYYIVKICKMKPEERKAFILNFLKGAVVAAEEYFGSGHGQEKLAYVEEYFKKKAPWLVKILFMISGAESLSGLIEDALTAVKGSFGTSEKKEDKTNENEKEG